MIVNSSYDDNIIVKVEISVTSPKLWNVLFELRIESVSAALVYKRHEDHFLNLTQIL